MTKKDGPAPAWTAVSPGSHSDYDTVWHETNQVLALWVNALPRYHTLALPVAVLLAARLIAVSLEAALADHAGETSS